MRFRLRVGVILLLLGFYATLAHQVRSAETRTQNDKAELLDTLTPKISQAADQLVGSSADILRAADQISQKQTCAMDRELLGLGAALQKASEALKMLEPMLLEKEPVNLSVLVHPDPNSPSARAFANNLRRTNAYRAALANVAEAGRRLTLLDPLGTKGPPAEAAQLLRDAGQSLLDLDEKSGIGLHIKHTGESMDTLRVAILRYDKSTCAHAARLMGHMVGLTGENLAGSVGALMQSSGALSLAGSLYLMSTQMPTPSLAEIDLALNLYERALDQVAASFTHRATIARAVNPPKGQPDASDFFRFAATQFETWAAAARMRAAHVAQARKLLTRSTQTRTSAQGLAAALQAAGTELKEFGDFASLIETGNVLFQVGRLLEDNQPRAASEVLKEAALKISNDEKPLVQLPR